MTSVTHSDPRVCGSTVECLLTQRSLGSFSGLSAQPHHSSLSVAPPCNVKHVDSSSSQGFSQLVPTLIISHVLSNHQHTHLQSASPAHLHCQRQMPASPLLGCLQESLFPSSSYPPRAEELFSTTQKPSSAVPWKFASP